MSRNKTTILVQLDTDTQPSVFDAVVAVDAGVRQLLRHGGVTADNVRDLVYGTIFTRGPADLNHTAIFVGGSNVSAGEAILEVIKKAFFGPFRVSVMFDGNGSNTTAAAAVLTALQASGGTLQDTRVLILGATGPVGQRIALLLGRLGAVVAVGSRSLDRAGALAKRLHEVTGAQFIPFQMANSDGVAAELRAASIVISSGPPGIQLLPANLWRNLSHLEALIDLNAVPPLGIEGVEAADKNKSRSGIQAWGALGVGGIKMNIHKKAIQQLFTANDLVLDAEEVLALGQSLD
jgi:methylenetetrahydrofolate/methylenetetrahydromethanopterin dehydrogenase (NADP+)